MDSGNIKEAMKLGPKYKMQEVKDMYKQIQQLNQIQSDSCIIDTVFEDDSLDILNKQVKKIFDRINSNYFDFIVQKKQDIYTDKRFISSEQGRQSYNQRNSAIKNNTSKDQSSAYMFERNSSRTFINKYTSRDDTYFKFRICKSSILKKKQTAKSMSSLENLDKSFSIKKKVKFLNDIFVDFKLKKKLKPLDQAV